ncbi:hypothetical protein CCACVL1_24613 [Corchorus capsularis]|uniref:Uncharacterized protein n=1 Tax=Corchorus capsularis TaxID=210143 RepID=A0A1R3GP35_COCAP|nr:hypothetical protein CCACVL1_24613 [Corchorus capsularis]
MSHDSSLIISVVKYRSRRQRRQYHRRKKKLRNGARTSWDRRQPLTSTQTTRKQLYGLPVSVTTSKSMSCQTSFIPLLKNKTTIFLNFRSLGWLRHGQSGRRKGAGEANCSA